MEYERLTAEHVCDLIKQANSGHWPQVLHEWVLVCHRFQCTLMIVFPIRGPKFGAALVQDPQNEDDRLIIVEHSHDESEFYGRISHEVCEHLTRWDGGGPEWRVPDSSSEAHHRVALRLEMIGEHEINRTRFRAVVQTAAG